MTRTQQFIKKYKKVLTSGADFFNPDTSLMQPEDFEKAKCKFLLILPTPHVVKTVSSTVAAINDFIITHCPDTFLDVAYMPENEDIKRYDEWKVPYAIGNITHLDASHFDLVGFSISVLNEVVTAPVILSTFDRCDKPIPLFWSQRKDAKLGEYPVIYAGGITAVCGESMFGKVRVNGNIEQAYMDFMYLGDCGQTHLLTNRFIEAVATGKCTRKQEDHDVPGYPHSDIENFEEVVSVSTIQEYVESLFDLQEIYQPQAYEVEYNKHNQIIKNIKINAKARDFVTPYYPHIMEPDLGIGRAVINANGDNCLIEGTRVWTDKGIFPIESVNNVMVFTGREYVEFQELKPSKGEVLEVKLNQGNSLKATPEHLQFVWDPTQGIKEVCVGTLKKGDWVLQHTGNSKGRAIVGSPAYFAGLWYGDGYRAGGSAKWLKDYYIAQCVAVHEKNLIDIIEDSEYHEIKSGTPSVRCFGLNKDSKLSKFIHNAFPNYKDDISSVLTWDDVEQLSFLRGLFDADGTSDKEGLVSLAMKESRRRVLEDVVVLLNKFGIRAHFMVRTTRAFDSTFGKCEIKIVGEKSYKNYFDFIGFTQDSKGVLKRTSGQGKDKCVPASLGPVLREHLYREGFRENTWVKRTGKHLSGFLRGKNGCCLSDLIELAEVYHNELLDLFKAGYSFTQVESVESIGVHNVYDIKNVVGHAFKAETFITHNCGTTQTQVSEGLYLAGTLIRTNDGLRKVEDIVSLEGKSERDVVEDVKVDTTAGAFKVYHAFSHGLSKAKKFTTESGYSICLSDEHPTEQYKFPVGWSWVPAGELKVGDYLTFKKGSSVFGNSKLDVNQAEFLGRMLGDGTYNTTKILYCSLAEHDYCVDLLNRSHLDYTEIKRESTYAFRLKAIDKLGNKIQDLYGFTAYTPGSRKYSVKSIPEAAYSLNEECTKSFLKGYHDAVGCASTQESNKGGVSKRLSKVTFDCCHKHIAEFIQQLLLMCGVPSKLHYYAKHRAEDLNRSFYEQDNDHWAVGVSSEYFDELNSWGLNKRAQAINKSSKEHIPFDYESARLLGKKIENTVDRSHYYTILKGKDNRRLTRAVCKKHGFNIPSDSLFFDRIVSIEEVTGLGYDLSVSSVEKLIANGCSVHNCSAGGACSFMEVASTRIFTNKGIITLKDAHEQGVELVQAISPEKLEGIKYCGEHDVYRVTLKSGHYNEGDENHVYMVFQDGELKETKAKDLIPGQIVFRRLGTDFIYEYQEDRHGNVFTEGKARLLGFMHGDGHFGKYCKTTHSQQWRLYTKQGEGEYIKLFNHLLGESNTRVAYEAGVNTVFENNKNCRYDQFFDADLATVSCDSNYVPDVVFNSPESVKKAYIRGLFDADGWSNHKGIGVTTISEKFAQDIALLLQSIGYDTHVVYNGYFERKKVKGHRPSWMVTIPVAYMSKFRFEIGFSYKDCSERKSANWCNTSLPRTNNLVDCMRKAWTKRDYCREEGLSNCYQYVSDHNKNIGVNLLRKFKDLHPDIQLPNFYEQVAKGVLVPDEIKSVEFTGEKAEMFDVVNTETHLCSYGTVLTHQCSEGNYTGGWVEKEEDQIMSELREAKKYSAGYKYKPYSFNANYVKDYKGKLAKFIQLYPKVTFINMRMEELGRDVDALKMMKLIGSNRISAPMEGMSPRLQNNLLNKCLSEESLQNFMAGMVHAKMTDIKCCVKDTLTPVEGQGLLRQNLLADGYPVGMKSFITDILEVVKEKTMKLNFSRGVQIEVTPEHKFSRVINPISEADFVLAKDLKQGDTLYIKLGSNAFGTEYQTVEVKNYCNAFTSKKNDEEFEIKLDEEFAEILGWCTGDGSLETDRSGRTNRVRFYFAVDELDVAEKVANWLKKYGFYSSEGWVKSSVYCVRSYKKNFTYLMEDLLSHKFDCKIVPDCVLTSPKSVQVAYIRGLMGADGTICNILKGVRYHSTIALTLHNEQIVRTVQQMLFNLGIVSHIRKGKSKCKGNEFPTWSLTILQQHHRLYQEIVGFWGRKDKFELCSLPEKGLKDSIKEKDGFIPVQFLSRENSENEVYKLNTSNHLYLTNGFISHNCGGIFTGYEEEEDFQWICDFVDKFKERAAREGGNFPFRLKMTPLVHYPLTPIEYLERKSARRSYEGEHWLTDEWYEKFREHQVFFKVNGFRYSTFLEQTFVDLGRSLTPLIYKHFVSQTAPVYSLRSCATDEYLADLKAIVDKDVYFEDRDPEKYISPCHRIHIELMGSYIPRARRLLRHKKEGNIFANEPDIRCLKTFEGAKVKCYHSCIVKDPLKIYYDVTMDEEGNLHGESYDLTGCQRCPTNEQRKNRLAREIVQTKNSEDIIATRRMPQVQKIRFVLKREEEYDCLNPNNTAHTFMTKFLQLSDNLLDSYHSIICHNMFWQCSPGFKFFTSGYQIVDTMWSKNVIKEVNQLIPQVNELLKSVKVISAEEILRDEKIAITDLNFYTFESSLPRELFDAACHTYKGQIKVEAKVQGFALTEAIDSSLEKPVFASKGGKTIGCFWIPARYNPVMYLAGFLSQAKRTSEDGVVTTTNFSCKMTMRENKMACKNCGKENALISISTGKVMPFGKSCLCKAILTQMIK